ncbi:MAG: DUF1512 domain-containing protein [Candidatus Bathyarchaeia archaeon]
MIFDVALQLAPTGGGNSLLSNLMNLVIFGMIFASFFFGQQIQSRIAILQLDGAVRKLEFIRSDAKALALRTIKAIGKPKDDPSPALSGLLEQFFISPVDMDPAGIVGKLDHLLDVRDLKFKADVKKIAPEATDAQANNLENLVEASWALNLLYKVVRHFYLLGKKTSSFYIILQLQMLLPLIMQEAEAYAGAAKAFALGQPVGDGAGALVASRLMRDHEKREVDKDVMVAETTIEGRRVMALKAKGPGGNVGKPGDAIRTLIEENAGKVTMVVMVDAALKFEGEKTGEITEGIGAAIGGVGTERFKIEAEATKYKIPVYAVIVKESIQEAITPMKKEIAEAANGVIQRIKTLIQENTKEGDLVIVAGIGNTVGIAQ